MGAYIKIMEINTIKNILDFIKKKENKVPSYIKLRKLNLMYDLENYPDDVQFTHNDNLYLYEMPIKKLPNKFNVKGYLMVKDCKNLKELSGDLRVEGWADLTGLNITKLPDKIYVDEYLDLDSCEELIKLPSELYVGGSLNLSDCVKIKELPDNLYVGGNFGIISTQIEDFPNNLYVRRDIGIRNTPLAKKYTDEEIRSNKNLNGGKFEGKIFR